MGALLETTLAQKRIVLLLGAGGVGKTTSSIALAFWAAMQGKNVALLSIDPARRLAAALGIPLSLNLQEINWRENSEEKKDFSSQEKQGRVFAGMLDQKAVFDHMVLKHAPSAEIARKILAHPLYQSASTNLSGPIEYMALAKLQELADDPTYDMIIVDTPPDTHALDFLARPNVLGGFMDQGVLSWLIKPFLMASRFGLSRFLNTSERLMGGISRVTGLGALTSFAEFLVLIQDIIEGFHKSGERIVSLLHQKDTGFVLVMVPTQAAARSAFNIHHQLGNLGYKIDLVVFNRTLPRDLTEALDLFLRDDQEVLSPRTDALSVDECEEWRQWAKKAQDQSLVIEKTLDGFEKSMAAENPTRIPWIRVEEQKQNLGDLASTLRLALTFGRELKDVLSP